MQNISGSADHLRTIGIPRRIRVSKGAAMEGRKHGPHLMAIYGSDGRLVLVFDSSREVDLMVPQGPDDQPVRIADLERATVVPFGDGDAPGVTYFIGGDTGAIKIGRTVNLATRLKDIQACSPIPVRVLATRQGADREKLYHRLFSGHRQHGEWFDRHPDILAEIACLNGPRTGCNRNEGLTKTKGSS